MINLKLKDGRELAYDEAQDQVLLDGKKTDKFHPAFIPNGDEEPQFFGFTEKSTGKFYDLQGHQLEVVDEDKIKL